MAWPAEHQSGGVEDADGHELNKTVIEENRKRRFKSPGSMVFRNTQTNSLLKIYGTGGDMSVTHVVWALLPAKVRRHQPIHRYRKSAEATRDVVDAFGALREKRGKFRVYRGWQTTPYRSLKKRPQAAKTIHGNRPAFGSPHQIFNIPSGAFGSKVI